MADDGGRLFVEIYTIKWASTCIRGYMCWHYRDLGGDEMQGVMH
jgi:hypothetical protein